MPTAKDGPPDEQHTVSGGFLRVMWLGNPEWGWLLLGFVWLILGTAPQIGGPLYFGSVIDQLTDVDATVSDRKAAVNQRLSTFGGGSLVASAVIIGRTFIFNAVGERVLSRIRLQMFQSLMSQGMNLFDTRHAGDLLARVSGDAQLLQTAVTNSVIILFQVFVKVFLCTIIMFTMNWKLAVVVVIVIPFGTLAMMYYGKTVLNLTFRYGEYMGLCTAAAHEAVSAMRTVRSFAAEEIEVKKFETFIGNPDNRSIAGWILWQPRVPCGLRLGVRKHMAGAGFMLFFHIVGFGSFVLILWMGSNLVINGEMTGGDIFSFILYGLQIGASVTMLTSILVILITAKAAAIRIFEIIDLETDIPLAEGLEPLDLIGDIRFQSVSFHYPSRPMAPVLVDLTLDIPRHKTCAFVGASGAGKSTILALIQRFYDVTGGDITIDGLPLTCLSASWVRSKCAYVQQEPALFAGSILRNISYGHSAELCDHTAYAEMERVEPVARAAFAHDFILRTPKGYDTFVGEKGVNLSGGQKQRIAIARALLKEPRLLLLDEATSALDTESEAFVAEAISKAMVGRTTLIVAHRLSTVLNAEQIVCMEKGTIIDIGTHKELAARCEKYQELIRRQLIDTPTSDDGGLLKDSPDQEAPIPPLP